MNTKMTELHALTDAELEEGCDRLQDLLADTFELDATSDQIKTWRLALVAGLAELHRRGVLVVQSDYGRMQGEPRPVPPKGRLARPG